jgi:hypothetical protein
MALLNERVRFAPGEQTLALGRRISANNPNRSLAKGKVRALIKRPCDTKAGEDVTARAARSVAVGGTQMSVAAVPSAAAHHAP